MERKKDNTGFVKCYICGKTCKDVLRIHNKKVCHDCAKKPVKCTDCERLLTVDEAIYILGSTWSRNNKEYVCKDCAPRYRKCKDCGDIFCLPERIDYFPKIPSDLILCTRCVGENSKLCSCCDEWYLEDNIIEIDGCEICKDCFPSNTYPCVKCGKPTIRNRESRSIDGLCQDCESAQIYKDYVLSKIGGNCYKEEHNWFSFKNTRTVPIMTRIRKNEGILLLDIGIGQISKILIIFDLPDKCRRLISDECTATNFKKRSICSIKNLDNERTKEPLCLSDGVVLHIWENPYRIRAVTDYNTDFRKEWRNGFLEYEGNNYGDTSDFYIIGMSD